MAVECPPRWAEGRACRKRSAAPHPAHREWKEKNSVQNQLSLHAGISLLWLSFLPPLGSNTLQWVQRPLQRGSEFKLRLRVTLSMSGPRTLIAEVGITDGGDSFLSRSLRGLQEKDKKSALQLAHCHTDQDLIPCSCSTFCSPQRPGHHFHGASDSGVPRGRAHGLGGGRRRCQVISLFMCLSSVLSH